MKTENWKKVRLGDILLIQKKSKIKASDGIENGIYPFFTCSNDIVRTYNSAQYKGPALIFGTGGKASVHFCDTEFSTSTDCLTYYPVSSEINLDLVNQYIQSNIYLLENGFKGAGLKHVSRDYIANIEINLPDIKTQNCIVQKLNKAKNIISNSKKLLTKYDLLIKSRFIEMFGENPIENENWKVESLENICNLITDGTHKTPNYQTSGIKFISARNIKNGKIDLTDTKFITEEEYQIIQKRCRIETGDVLLTKSGSLGDTAIIDFSIPIGLFESLAVLKYKREKIDGIYLQELLKMNCSQKQFKSGVKGIAIKHLHLNIISTVKIPVPPLALQQQFAAFAQQIDKSKFTVQKSLEKAETLYKSLMQQYFA